MAHAVPAAPLAGILGFPRAAAAGEFTFLESYECLQRDGAFLCLGRGGNGGVYDVRRAPRHPYTRAALLRLELDGETLAGKQTVYPAAKTMEELDKIRKAIRREGAESVELAEKFLARPQWSVLAVTLDYYQFRSPGEADCTAHTVMERSPIGKPKLLAPHGEEDWPAGLPRRRGKMDGSNTDALECPFFAAGRLEMREARYIMRQLLVALQALHDAGRVHRDVKPDNLLIWGCSKPGLWEGEVVPATEMIPSGEFHAVMGDRRLERLEGTIAPPPDVPVAAGDNPFVCKSLPFPAGDDDTRYVWVSPCCCTLAAVHSTRALHSHAFTLSSYTT